MSKSPDCRLEAIHQWLQCPNPERIFQKCIDKKHPGTCEWLLTDPTFGKWENATRRGTREERLLWIYGPPGIGKTFLATSVIERVKSLGSQKAGAVIYYFFNDEKSENPLQPGAGASISLLRSLATQLVDNIEQTRPHGLPPTIWDQYDKSDGECLSDIECAVKLVTALLTILPRVHVVIDGLDECIDRDIGMNQHSRARYQGRLPYILERLVKQSTPYGFVKWCFTSCAEKGLSTIFQELKAPHIAVTPEHTESDIQSYVHDFFQYLLPSHVEDETPGGETPAGEAPAGEAPAGEIPPVEASIVAMLRCLSARNFLDVRLTLDTLSGNSNMSPEHVEPNTQHGGIKPVGCSVELVYSNTKS
jgi:hypothetical protein